MHHAQYPILPNVRKEKHDPKSREKASNRNKPPECPRYNY